MVGYLFNKFNLAHTFRVITSASNQKYLPTPSSFFKVGSRIHPTQFELVWATVQEQHWQDGSPFYQHWPNKETVCWCPSLSG